MSDKLVMFIMSEYTRTVQLAKKFIHPRVVKVLQDLSSISPVLVPRDQDQPKQGSLFQIKLQRSDPIPSLNLYTTKEESTLKLTLNSSLLRRRKQSMG